MEISSGFPVNLSSPSLIVALILTALCCIFAVLVFRSSPRSESGCGNSVKKRCCRACNCKAVGVSSEKVTAEPYLNGGTSVGGIGGEMVERALLVSAEQQSGASMMEQLVPEITTHALSYLDYPSLCRLSMTNSLMRKAANDDNAWKALYHKDFTFEQDNVTPVNGWKAYYASTRAIVNINGDFFNIIKERSLPAMGRFWLNADYVKCIHASGELFTGYSAVMESWQLAFNWQQVIDFQIRDIRARVLADAAWVTMKAFVDMETGPFNVTNVFEFQNGRWYMVHHHCSVMLINGGGDQQLLHLQG